ncbi:MAG: fructosamine kinase family protein [Anaerolineales bacterium]|nr:fructosamine kinase family protein [Anaerolineales bacterium]
MILGRVSPSIPSAVAAWLSAQKLGDPVRLEPVGGGCINSAGILITSSGERFFLKTNPSCPADMFACEADGLRALAKAEGGPRVPDVYLHGPDFILIEDLAPAPRSKTYWTDLGRQMASLHHYTAEKFGFEADNYIGSTPQPNPWTVEGYQFYARHRFGFQAEMAAQRGLLSHQELTLVSDLAARLPSLVPAQPASLMHGDLWNGNQITDAGGNPAIIDPAAYYGWAEADLAMMILFGSPGRGFWEAYNEVRPLEPGYQERFGLYNLYHLLNHLNLFGRSYHGQVVSALLRYR